jgi:hypothetical protein
LAHLPSQFQPGRSLPSLRMVGVAHVLWLTRSTVHMATTHQRVTAVHHAPIPMSPPCSPQVCCSLLEYISSFMYISPTTALRVESRFVVQWEPRTCDLVEMNNVVVHESASTEKQADASSTLTLQSCFESFAHLEVRSPPPLALFLR